MEGFDSKTSKHFLFFVEQEMEDRWDTKIEATEEEESNITLLALVIVEIE